MLWRYQLIGHHVSKVCHEKFGTLFDKLFRCSHHVSTNEDLLTESKVLKVGEQSYVGGNRCNYIINYKCVKIENKMSDWFGQHSHKLEVLPIDSNATHTHRDRGQSGCSGGQSLKEQKLWHCYLSQNLKYSKEGCKNGEIVCNWMSLLDLCVWKKISTHLE